MIKLLIADDEDMIRRGLLTIGWKDIGIHVVAVVDNGLDAIEILQSDIIDILLTDIRMPGIDGLEIARFVYEQELCTEVILLSGYNDFEYARSGIKYNVMRYILKPSSPEEIINAVKQACKQVDKRREADMRMRLLEAELGKRQLVMDNDGIVLGEIEHSSIVDNFFEYTAKNYTKPISLSALSDELHFSTIYISKVIKKTTGYTFLDIVNAMRIHNAASKLREGKCTLDDISKSVCINGARYFCQIFKKYYGVTPSSYRKAPCMPLDTKLAYLVQSIHDIHYEADDH